MTEPNQPLKPSPPVPPDTQWIGIHISRKTYLLIHAALVLPYFLIAGFVLLHWEQVAEVFADKKPVPVAVAQPSPLSAQPNQVMYSQLQSGPWGRLDYIPIYIECPEEFLNVRSYEMADRRWFFEGYSAEAVAAFVARLPLSGDQRSELADQTKWKVTADGVYLDPSRELRLDLASAARQQIYPVIADGAEIFKPIAIPGDSFDKFFERSGVAPETVAMVRKLCYPHGSLLFLSNIDLVLDTLPEYADKVRLIKALSRKASLLLSIHVRPGDDINALDRYWTKACWGKDFRPMLESLAEVPGGARMSVVNIFPPLPSAQLNTFPLPSAGSSAINQDCHWTSLNFFKDVAEPRLGDVKFAAETLKKDYYPAVGDPTYGDVVCFFRRDGGIIHSAVFIADDVVYTKNGAHFLQPWMLMRLPELQERYTAQIPEGEKLTVRYYRSKYY